MIPHHRTAHAMAIPRALLVMGAMAGSLSAATTFLPSAASGFDSPYAPQAPTVTSSSSTFVDEGGNVVEQFLDGFTYTTFLSGLYDTNALRIPDNIPGFSPEEDFIMSVGGNVAYLSKASELTFGGFYRGSYDQYFNASEFSGFNQGAGLQANYEVGRFIFNLVGTLDFDRGVNRNYQSAFVEQTIARLALRGRYLLSRKTSVVSNTAYRATTAQGDFQDTQSFDFDTSALWKFSPLTEFGPGIRTTYRIGDSPLERTTVGPTFNVNYKLSEKVSLSTRFGMDFINYSDGQQADPDFTTALTLAYNASQLWNINFALYRDTEANFFNSEAFDEVTSARLTYVRKVGRAVFDTALTYEIRDSQTRGRAQDRQQDFLTAGSSLGMRIFRNTTVGRVFVRYSELEDDRLGAWDSVQTGFSLSREF